MTRPHPFWILLGLSLALTLVAGIRLQEFSSAVLLLPLLGWMVPRLRPSATGSEGYLVGLPLVFIAPDVLFGTPSIVRFALAAVASTTVLASLSVAWGISRVPRWIPATLAMLLLLWSVLALKPIQNGADHRLGQDTAYFTQVVYRASQGGVPRGDVVTAVLYHPPLRSHFGAHISPIIYAIAPLFWIWPAWTALALLRSVAVFSTAWIIGWWCRGSYLPPVLAAILFLSIPSLWVQSMHAVYLLPLAAPFALLFWIGGSESRPKLAAIGLLGLLFVREDVVLMACLGLALLLLVQRRWRGAVLAGVVGIGWYGVSTVVWMPLFGDASGEAVGGLFARYGGLGGLLREPWQAIPALLQPRSLDYAWAQLRSTGMLALLHPATLCALPAYAINALASGQGFGTLELAYHYAILPALAVGFGAVSALRARLDADGRVRLPLMGRPPLASVVVVFLAGGALTALDTIDLDRVAGLRGGPQQEWVRNTLRELPRTLSVAAPRAYLPHLATHDELYMINRLNDYPNPQPDAWLVTEDIASLHLRDGTEDDYRQTVHELATRADVELVGASGSWKLYRRHGTTAP